MSFTSPRLSPEGSDKVVASLQGRLAALIDLSLTLKHVHWNVVGPNFIGVHEMLDPQYAAVALMVDETAERIATLGGEPDGTPGRVVERRTWDDYALGRADVQSHLGALDKVYEGVVSSHGDAIEVTGDIDPVTEDMLIGQTRQLEQFHWFIRAHLETSDGSLSTEGATTERKAARQASAAVAGRKDAAAPARRVAKTAPAKPGTKRGADKRSAGRA